MALILTDDQTQLRDSARDFLSEQSPVSALRQSRKVVVVSVLVAAEQFPDHHVQSQQPFDGRPDAPHPIAPDRGHLASR